jgi:hypothetical protein
MKKRLLNLLFLSAVVGMASAQKLTVAPVEIMQGKTASFELNIDVEGNNYTGLQFDMKFPAKFATTKGNELKANWNKGSINPGSLNSEGKGTVSCFTMDNTAFIPNGILGTIEFSTEAEVGVYDVTLSKVTFMTSTEKKEIADVTFKVSVVDAITLDENSTTAPSAASGVNVKVKRTISGGKWSTICLPFAMTAEQVTTAFGSGVKLGEFVEYAADVDNANNVVSITVAFNAVNAIEANYPYIIKVENDIPDFTVNGVDIAPDEVFAEFDNGMSGTRRKVFGTFIGTYVAGTPVPAKTLFLADGKFWYATSSTKQMKAFRGYFDFVDILTAAESASSRINITFDDVTAIKSIKTSNSEDIYTLSGQRVKNAGKGVYIVNGKKVIKK